MPEGCKAIIVSDQLAARFVDWRTFSPDEHGVIECRVIQADDVLTADVECRYRQG